MDEDLDGMSREQLIAEVRSLRRGIRTHRDSTGHELCWHHPALWGLLPEKQDPIPTVPEWPEFLRGCVTYRQSLDEQAPAAPRSSNGVELVLEFFARVWHPPHDLRAIDELMTEDYVITSAGKVIEGREAFKAWVNQFHAQLLDAQTESVDAFADSAGQRVVSRWICTGRHNGLLGLPPTGRPLAFTGIAIWRVRDGRLAQCWAERSAWELYQELTKRPA